MMQRHSMPSSDGIGLYGWAVGACVGLLTISTSWAAADYEQAPVLGASKILPPDVISGPNHRIDPTVVNDGYMNHYTINSRFGVLKAQSDTEVRIRVAEINAVAAMEKVERSEEFIEGIGEKGQDVLDGAKNLITDPADTVSGAMSGVGRLFQRARDSVAGDPKSKSEGSALAALTGVSQAKRQYAYQFGVDAYSSNPVLQDHLTRIARASAAGGLGASVGLMAIPGGAGIAVSVAGSTEQMNEFLRDTPPVDLRRSNREKLEAMGVSIDIVDLFMANTVLSPRHQTLIVAALEEMKGTADRGQFVKFAISTDSEDLALFRQRQAQLYAGYHRKVKPIERFVPIGELTAARSADDAIVFNVPLDYLVWTEAMARVIEAANRQVESMQGVKKKELWLAGSLSPRARKELEGRGWVVYDRVQARLM